MTRRAQNRRGGAPAPESRTLVVVAVASMAVGLLAFVLGARYGLERSDQAEAATVVDPLHRLDRQAERLRALRQRERERTKLSFHESLSGPPRKAAPRELPTRSIASAPAVAAPETEPTVEPKAEPTVSPAAMAAVEALAREETAPVEPLSAPETAPELPDQAAPDGTDQEAQSAAVLAAAQMEEEEEGPELEAARSFSLQVGAFPDEAKAEALVKQLSAKGYRVHVASARVDGRGTWYRVRVGSFDDRDTADAERSRLSSNEGLFALVVPET